MRLWLRLQNKDRDAIPCRLTNSLGGLILQGNGVNIPGHQLEPLNKIASDQERTVAGNRHTTDEVSIVRIAFHDHRGFDNRVSVLRECCVEQFLTLIRELFDSLRIPSVSRPNSIRRSCARCNPAKESGPRSCSRSGSDRRKNSYSNRTEMGPQGVVHLAAARLLLHVGRGVLRNPADWVSSLPALRFWSRCLGAVLSAVLPTLRDEHPSHGEVPASLR
jgi:hypothetical protein